MGFCFPSLFFFSTTLVVSGARFESLGSHWMGDLMKEDSHFTFVMIEPGYDGGHL